MTKPKITLKQRRFVAAYLLDGNATQAAVEAGYSKKTARSIGQENLTKPAIKATSTQHNSARTTFALTCGPWPLRTGP
ncbi:MAG TPA: terminase small subunit [Gemmatimonadetes bacterium]|nr:terminase small subunit [Gemmatimonadota bacterium]